MIMMYKGKKMNTMNGVVNIISGLLLRCGYCDFVQDSSFDPETEAQHSDVPYPRYLANDPYEPDSPNVTHWNGNGWDEVPRTVNK
jgi:hypothetical protein